MTTYDIRDEVRRVQPAASQIQPSPVVKLASSIANLVNPAPSAFSINSPPIIPQPGGVPIAVGTNIPSAPAIVAAPAPAPAPALVSVPAAAQLQQQSVPISVTQTPVPATVQHPVQQPPIQQQQAAQPAQPAALLTSQASHISPTPAAQTSMFGATTTSSPPASAEPSSSAHSSALSTLISASTTTTLPLVSTLAGFPATATSPPKRVASLLDLDNPVTDNDTPNSNTSIRSILSEDAQADTSMDEDSKNKKAGLSANARSYKHIKKKDGEPLWRKEIQFDFQQILFDNNLKVFTNPFPDPQVYGVSNPIKYTFAELYVRTLSESTKCSKILKERFLNNPEMAISVLKVCLLVNAGRMNTTINFVPEMRSTLRTYHSIPSLQADPVHGGSKPLQDTPRLKSILKNITIDNLEPYRVLDDLLRHPKESKPNTNLIDVIFLLSNHTHAIKYYDENSSNHNLENTFLDFFMNTSIHPKSRAQRFLWLVYTYLETSFEENQIKENPFADSEGNIPEPELISEEDYEKNFDIDTEFEIQYSEQMKDLRQKYLNDEEHNSTPKRGNKSKKEREEEDAMIQQYVEKLAGENGEEQSPSSTSPTPSNAVDEQVDEDAETNGWYKSTEDKKRHADDIEEIKKRAKKTLPFGAAVSSPLAQSVVSANDTEVNGYDEHGKDSVSNGAPASSHYGNNGAIPSNTPLGLHTIRMKNSDHNPEFPIETMDILLEIIHEISTIAPTNKTSMASHFNISNKSRPLIRQYRGNAKILSVDFATKLEDLKEWLEKYFQYKKSSNNGILGMEWENLRYDLINGIETFVYKQDGKFYNSVMQSKNPGERLIDQPQGASDGSTESQNGSSTSENDEVGFGFVPIYDFNKINELNTFLRDLIKLSNVSLGIDEIKSLKKHKPRNQNYIKFDLDAGKVDVNLEF